MRLIDGNETMQKVEQIPFIANENKAFYEGCRYMQKKVLRLLHESKSVDAVPMQHGHWEYVDTHLLQTYHRCSECGNVTGDYIINPQTLSHDKPYYCPNCGSKMLDDEVSE